MSILGQPLAFELIERTLLTGRIAPAYLFCGPPGVGKATTARYFAARLLASDPGRIERRNHPDLWWMEPTYKKGERLYSRTEALQEGVARGLPQIRLEQVRAIAGFLSHPPLEAARQVVVIDEAEALGEAAANALLKTLEEPGSAIFVLIAPPGELLATVRSRCQRIPFYPLAEVQLAEVLARHDCPSPLPARVLAIAQGSPGRALELLEWFAGVPADLLAELEPWTRTPLSLGAALALARRIDGELSPEAQLPLIDYLQQWAWENGRPGCCHALEALKRQLVAYVSPRLAWEVALAELSTSRGENAHR